MDNNKLRFTGLQSEILELLFDYPTTSFSEREISRNLGVSPTAVSNALEGLETQAFVEVKKKFMLDIRLNPKNESVPFMKRVSNLRKIYTSGLAQLLDETFPGSTIVLFGSYAHGEDTERSDIDIAIIGSRERKMNLDALEKILRRRVNVQFFHSMKIDKELKENIINGITLKGHMTI
jgi:predicted nucleotidyltransferase